MGRKGRYNETCNFSIPGSSVIYKYYASVENHIPRDNSFDYHPLRECNINLFIPNITVFPFFLPFFS